MSTTPATATSPATRQGASAPRAAALAREVPAGRRPGWWGMVLALVSDVSAFASLLAGYYYVRFVTSAAWPPPGDPLPRLLLSSVMTGLLVVSVAPMALADRGLRAGSRGRATLGCLVTATCPREKVDEAFRVVAARTGLNVVVAPGAAA